MHLAKAVPYAVDCVIFMPFDRVNLNRPTNWMTTIWEIIEGQAAALFPPCPYSGVTMALIPAANPMR